MSQSPHIHGLRPRYVRRVGPDDVGERVSIRHLVDDPERGPVPTDVVGRLVAFDADLAVVVNRKAELALVDPERILASRTIPAHPRLAAEPRPSREHPLPREAARVLLFDGERRVLLVAHHPDPGETVWTAPGGGLREAEGHIAAARRELIEELGLDVRLGDCVWHRQVTFPFRGVWLAQSERWYTAELGGEPFDPHQAPLDDAGTTEARWWSLADLRGTTERLAPSRFADHLAALLRDGPPTTPLDVAD